MFALAIAFTFLSLQMLATEQHWKEQYRQRDKEAIAEEKKLNEQIAEKDNEIDTLRTKEKDQDATIKTLTEEKNEIDTVNKQLTQNQETL